MPIRARCPDCDKGYAVEERNAGKTLKCKACGGAVKVPMAAGTGAAVTASPQQKPAARPAAKARPVPAAAEPSGDAFGDMDALLALESGGTVMEDQPVLAPPPLPAKPARAATGGMPPRPGSTIPQRRPGWQKNNDMGGMGNGLTGAQIGKILGIGGGAIALIFVLGLLITPFKLIAFMILTAIGGLLLLTMWAGCLMCAAREECLLLYIILPYYPIYFVLTRIDQTKMYLLAGIGGIVSLAAGIALLASAGKSRERAEVPTRVTSPMAFVVNA